jgi:molecular chaperone GrpE (heat shock protein)
VNQNVPMDMVLVIDNSKTMRDFEKETITSFIESIRNERLCIVSFDTDAKTIYPFREVSRDEDIMAVKVAIKQNITFSGLYTDINAGLNLSLLELQRQGREGYFKAVVLFSDGKIDPPLKRGSKGALLKELEERILPAFLQKGIPIYSIVFTPGDLQTMRKISTSTGGISLVVPDSLGLVDALPLLAQILQIKRLPEKRIEEASPPIAQDYTIEVLHKLTLIFGVGVSVSLLIGIVVATLVLSVRRKIDIIRDSQPEASRPIPIKETSFTSLRDDFSLLANQLKDSESELRRIKGTFEDYGAKAWQKTKKQEENRIRCDQNIVLLLDHLHNIRMRLTKNGENSKDIDLLYEKARQICEDEGISEIHVKIGEKFDGGYHRQVDSRSDNAESGTILEVVREGYLMSIIGDGETERYIVLRPVDVNVSSGPQIK